MNFNDRLKDFRISLGIKTKRDMAKILNISESFYNMLENGVRPPSKKILMTLVKLSKKPEEYWVYGVKTEKEWIKKREEFKCLKDAIDQLSEIGLLKAGQEYSEAVKEVILAAAIADIDHILKKRDTSD